MARTEYDIMHYGGRPCLDGFIIFLNEDLKLAVVCNPAEGGNFTLSIAEFKEQYSIHEVELSRELYRICELLEYVKL